MSLTCKYEKDRMKNSRVKVATSILDAQGQITLWSVALELSTFSLS